MAYNREWDQGKDVWHEGQWNGTDHRTNIRPREDEHYGDVKRRKYNNGGFQGGYDTTQGYEDSGYDRNQRQSGDHVQDHGHDDRRPGFNKKRIAPSEPSPHVIFLGLDPDFTEADGFGFAQFTTTEHARAFVDPLFPFIQVPPPASHGASATAAYYKSHEMGTPTNGRRVKIDYSQSASPHDRGRANRGNMNDGTRDIGNTQSPVLLFRGLDPLSGPQAIHQAMLYSSGPTMKGAKGMKRIILIKDKVTMASFGFAFVEFVDVTSASAVLAATMSPIIHPAGFRISDRPVAASFAHPYSFQPVTDFLSRDEACLMSSMSLGGVEGQWVRYWDESSTVAVLEFKVEEPVQPAQSTKEKKKKEKKSGAEARPAPAAPSALPVSDKPVMLSFSKGPTKAAIVAAAKKVAPLIASKKTVSNINKWNQVQEELTQETSIPLVSTTTTLVIFLSWPYCCSKPLAMVLTSNALRIQTAIPGPSSVKPIAQHATTNATPVPTETEFEFSDVTGLMCLLCARQFKSLDQLKRHNKESDLHKARHFNAVYPRDFFGLTSQKVAARKTESQDQPKYRDRASERRVLFNQPDVPVPENTSAPTTKQKKYEPAPRPPTPPPPPPNPAQDTANVGNKLLKMMGWTEGTGLGTTGEGRVEPIQTAIYEQGAGLGASKGKEIGKYAQGYSGYVHMAQDAVSVIISTETESAVLEDRTEWTRSAGS
ncbi:hypothetical protein DXG03_005182 [Asterophora parasitica]|uniref:G-patch domain-containing protein n=1 Tax=Asterophora parasitica TaxID=117018 RepID=A0A9P7KEF0_9AGAR|nr:hypothetical protein DXG03_005182 [Asterophora parasitica]